MLKTLASFGPAALATGQKRADSVFLGKAVDEFKRALKFISAWGGVLWAGRATKFKQRV